MWHHSFHTLGLDQQPFATNIPNHWIPRNFQETHNIACLPSLSRRSNLYDLQADTTCTQASNGFGLSDHQRASYELPAYPVAHGSLKKRDLWDTICLSYFQESCDRAPQATSQIEWSRSGSKLSIRYRRAIKISPGTKTISRQLPTCNRSAHGCVFDPIQYSLQLSRELLLHLPTLF